MDCKWKYSKGQSYEEYLINLVKVRMKDSYSKARKFGKNPIQTIGLLFFFNKSLKHALMQELGISQSYLYKLAKKAQEWIEGGCKEAEAGSVGKVVMDEAFIKRLIIAMAIEGCTVPERIAATLYMAAHVDISPTRIRNYLDEVNEKARVLNKQIDELVLPEIRVIAEDEIYQGDDPVFTVIDLDNLYVVTISPQENRQAETWEKVMNEAKDNGLNPILSISDACGSLLVAIPKVWSSIGVQIDIFHTLMNLGNEIRKIVRKVESKINKEGEYEHNFWTRKVHMSSIEKQIALQIELEKDVDLADRAEICMDCIRELLGYSGYTVEEVKGLIEFYLDELESIAEEMHFGKAVNAVRIFRKNLPRTMSYLNHMFTRTEEYATERGIAGALLKHVYRLRRFVKGSEAYYAELKKVLLQNRCDASVYREAQKLMDFVVDTNRRASSMVENLNGRIRPYMNIKRSVSDHFTELLKLYYNTKIALRSRVKERIGTSPIGRIIGENLDFFELLDMEEIADLASVLKGKTDSEVA